MFKLKENFAYFYKYLCFFIKFIHDHKKTRVTAKILENLRFLLFFWVPHFDKGKWYYIYIEKFEKMMFDSLSQFCDPDLESCHIYLTT